MPIDRTGQPIPTTPTTDNRIADDQPPVAPEKVIEVKGPQSPDEVKRKDVGRTAATKLLDIVTKHKEVAGTGQEAGAAGDPRVTQRRNALSTLLAQLNPNDVVTAALLEAIGDKVKADIQWLEAADRSDYKIDGDQKQFSWAKSSMSGSSYIKDEFNKRVKTGRQKAANLTTGQDKYFDVSNSGVIGLEFIDDAELRAKSMIDALLQFRARTDKANQKEVNSGSTSTRMDRIAPAVIAEQRILLANADFDAGDPIKLRDYALMREVISSHPMSSVNGIFDARNAVGKLFMDGNTNYSSKTHDMAWVRYGTPPGAATSAYAAIHHNFSRDTPGDIAAVITEWVFPQGVKDRRTELFLALCDALKQARAGDADGARKQLKELPPADGDTIKPLLDQLQGRQTANNVANAIAMFIVKGAQKPLCAQPRPELEGLGKKATSANKTSYNKEKQYQDVRDALAAFQEPLAGQLQPLKAAIKDLPNDKLGETITKWLADNKDLELVGNIDQNLDYFTRMYRAVCDEQPSVESLEKTLFKAGPAWPEVADVIAQMRAGKDLGTLKDLGEARLAMRDAIIAAKTGYERHELIKLDADLARLTCTELGGAVDRVENLKTDAQMTEALLAVQTALRAAVASGLHAIRDPYDPKARLGRQLDEVLASVDAVIAEGRIGENAYRDLMAEVYVSVARTVQNVRSFADARAMDVAAGNVALDPMFLDQFIKQSPLHYATALAEKGMRAGLKEEITARYIANIEGMRVLNSIGPVVFPRLPVISNNSQDLIKAKPKKDDLVVLYELSEKKMVAVGGLITDVEHAPGGNSHLNMYAMNNGIPVLALPELRTKYTEFFKSAEKEGGIYIDDSKGQLRMMTVAYAKERGILDDAKIQDLLPGTNKRITYLKPGSTADAFEILATHESIFSSTRPTRNIELYVPVDEVRGVGRTCTSFDDLAALGIQARHLAGEKGTVLALLRANPKLRPYVPDGSEITTGRVRGMLRESGLWDEWERIWREDPVVGIVDDHNFKDSGFYTDPDYRAEKREHLQEITKEKLTATMLGTGADGAPELTAAGQQLYAELIANPALARSRTGSIILRSSFTGEDRPGKSGAGQYESYVDRKLANKMYGKDKVDSMYGALQAAYAKVEETEEKLKANPNDDGTKSSLDQAKNELEAAINAHNAFMGPPRIEAAIGVIESTWMPEPIENNVADEVNLQHIECSVACQACLTPSISGVMISRDIEHGTRNQVSYQLVKGFGGGVEGGKTEEGVISASGHKVNVEYPGEPNGLTSEEKLKELREIVLEVEKYFHEVVEKDKGYAVDMEVAMQDGEWKVVQARVILIDK